MQNNNSYASPATQTHPLFRAWFNPEQSLERAYPEVKELSAPFDAKTRNSQRISTIKSLLLKYTDPKPQYDGMTAHEIATIIDEASGEEAQTLKAYQRINGCTHPEACDCFLEKVLDDTTPDDRTLDEILHEREPSEGQPI